MRLDLVGTALLLSAVPAIAQEGSEAPRLEDLELRVTAVRPGAIVLIDRGTSDGVAVGDSVYFLPRAGGRFPGVVIEVTDRGATVELFDGATELAPGTRGLMRLPAGRQSAGASGREASTLPDHPPWATDDEDWTPNLPLLASVEAIAPEQRRMQLSGRATMIADATTSSDNDRSDSFVRTGADVLCENPFGQGGARHVDGELNQRSTSLPDQADEDTGTMRIDRLSYALGGTRFDQRRQELGRFLSHGMPEFGVIDGYELTQRLEHGSRFGMSAGFMPEPDRRQESGHDLQFAGYYEWISDASESLSIAGGYQKTFHDGASDRDLVVGRLRSMPLQGWTTDATVWMDIYSAGDKNKGAGPELTRSMRAPGAFGGAVTA